MIRVHRVKDKYRESKYDFFSVDKFHLDGIRAQEPRLLAQFDAVRSCRTICLSRPASRHGDRLQGRVAHPGAAAAPRRGPGERFTLLCRSGGRTIYGLPRQYMSCRWPRYFLSPLRPSIGSRAGRHAARLYKSVARRRKSSNAAPSSMRCGGRMASGSTYRPLTVQATLCRAPGLEVI